MSQHKEIATFLLQKASQSIPPQDIVWFLSFSALKLSSPDLLICFLENVKELPSRSLGNVFAKVCKQGQQPAVDLLMQKAGTKIPVEWKGKALVDAAGNRQFAIAQTVWREFGTEISLGDKFKAVWGGFAAHPRAFVAFAITTVWQSPVTQSLPTPSVTQQPAIPSVVVAEEAIVMSKTFALAYQQMRTHKASGNEVVKATEDVAIQSKQRQTM